MFSQEFYYTVQGHLMSIRALTDYGQGKCMEVHWVHGSSLNIDTHESTSVSTNRKAMSEDNNKSARQCYHYHY